MIKPAKVCPVVQNLIDQVKTSTTLADVAAFYGVTLKEAQTELYIRVPLSKPSARALAEGRATKVVKISQWPNGLRLSKSNSYAQLGDWERECIN